jgi:hypothetical protein
MGKTYTKQHRHNDDEQSIEKYGKRAKHSNNRKSGGMKTLNSYVEEYIEFDDIFDDIEMADDINIQHIQHDTN